MVDTWSWRPRSAANTCAVKTDRRGQSKSSRLGRKSPDVTARQERERNHRLAIQAFFHFAVALHRNKQTALIINGVPNSSTAG